MFTDPLSERDLYWIGYIRADGHLMKPRKENHAGRLCFSQKHLEPVEALHNYVKATNPIANKMYLGAFNKPGDFGYDFSTKNAYSELTAIGVKSILREDIYRQIDFWRGMVDGDGCICLSKSSSGKQTVSVFLCASEIDAHQFVSFARSLGLERATIFSYVTSFKVQFGGEPAAYLLKVLYENRYSALPYKAELAKRGMLYRSKRTRYISPEARKLLYT